MKAEIRGHQRKVMRSSVRPGRRAWGTEGIVVRDGATLPFVVSREWNAPAGHYGEQWFLVEPSTREVVFESPVKETLVWGLQSLTELTAEVGDRIPIEPGTYQIVFALDGVMGGELDVEVRELPAEQAA